MAYVYATQFLLVVSFFFCPETHSYFFNLFLSVHILIFLYKAQRLHVIMTNFLLVFCASLLGSLHMQNVTHGWGRDRI